MFESNKLCEYSKSVISVFVSQWIVWRLLLLIVIFLFHLQYLCSFCQFHILFVHALIIHLHVPLGPVSSLNFFFNLSLSFIVWLGLSLFSRLNSHPVTIGLSILLIPHLAFKFLSSVEFSHVCNLLCFIELLLHQPIVHSFDSIFIFFSFLLSYMQKFFLNLLLSLDRKFSLQSFFSIFCLKPSLVWEAFSSIFL